MITTTELDKCYGATRAVSGLNWHVPQGSIYGLLGPNGAGKSTTLRMLLGMVIPTGGDATVAGLNVRGDSVAIRKLTAYIPDTKSVHGDMRVGDFVKFYGSFFPDWSSDEAIDRLKAWRVPLEQRMRKLSKGMMTKVLISAAFARKARLVLLDEPTEGLDPTSVADVLSSLAGWAATGDVSVVISSHRLDEVERICDHVGFIRSGSMVLSGELDQLRASCKTIDVDGVLPVETIRRWNEVHSATAIGNTVRVVTQREPNTVIERLTALHPRNIVVHDLNLRDIYLNFNPYSTEALS